MRIEICKTVMVHRAVIWEAEETKNRPRPTLRPKNAGAQYAHYIYKFDI